VPQINYGWNFAVPNYAAHIISTYGNVTSQTVQTWTQPCDPSHNNWTPITVSVYSFYKYYDSNGNPHPFNLSTSNYGGGCAAVNAPPQTGTGVAVDGSGYTLNVTTSGSIVTGTDGKVVNLVQTYTSAVLTTDSNGNSISETANGSSQAITDTLGQTVATIAGTNPVTFTYTAPSGGSPQYAINYSSYNVKTNFGCSGIAEFTQSGVSLISSISFPDGSSYQFSYEPTPNNGGYTTARLTQVTLPTGGSISYTYTGLNGGASCTNGSTLGLTKGVSPGGTWAYARHNVSGNQWTTTITTPPDPANSGSASDVTVINFSQDNNSNLNAPNLFETQRQVYQGSASPGNLLMTTMNCYNGNFTNCVSAQVTTPITQTDTYSIFPNGTTSLSEIRYNTYGLVSEDKEYDYGVATGAAPSTLPVRDTLSSYGSWNGTNCVALGNNIVSVPCQQTIKDGSGTIVAQTSYTYDETTPTTTSGTPQHSSITGSRGNLTTIATKVNGTVKLYQKFTYYDTGTLNTSTDLGTSSSGGPNTTTYTYGTGSCGNSFVTSISEPLGLSRSFTWDCTGGVMKSATDENGQTTTTYFAQTSTYGSPDTLFWRPYAATDQLGNATKFTYPSLTASESALAFNGTISVAGSRTKFDAFGRPIVNQRKQGQSVSSYDSVETDYDIFGRAYKTFIPYSAAADTLCTGTCPATVIAYDALGRPTSATDGGNPTPGTVNYTYTNNDVYQSIGPVVTGEGNTKRKQLEYDGLGRLTSVCEVTSATGSGICNQTGNPVYSGYWTTYAYDVLGNMTQVTQNKQALTGSQQSRSFTFDMIGRMLTENNPETGTVTNVYDSWDSSCGTYTSAGDLVEKKDAMNNVTCMKYDAMHRVTQITYPSGPYASATPTKCFAYATPSSPVIVNSQTMQNANLAVAEAYTTAASSCPGTPTVDEGFSYTARGETADVWQKTPDSGGWHHVNAAYWENGTLKVLNGGTNPLPGLPAITYGWNDGSGLDGEGRVTKVMAASGQNPVTCSTAPCVSYNTAGQLTGITFGSGDNDAYQYDGNTGRMTQYKFNMGTGPQSVTGALTWNPNGSLQKLVLTDQINSANTQTCKFGDPSSSVAGYDDLGRLIKADCASAWSQTFGFDPFGNMSKTGSAQFLPTYTGASGTSTTPSNQYYQISGGGAGASNYYDTNGNLKNDLTHTYTWDADGNMLTTDGSTVSMMYDALDRMIEITRGSTHNEVVYGPYGMKLALMNGTSLVNAFVKLPAGTAVYNNTGLAYYRHSDHLGSSRLSTTTSRTKYYDVAYAPYGEDYNGSGTVDSAFTDQNQDAAPGGNPAWNTNLYDFLMREYRAAHGRWASPDPAGLAAVSPSNPQSWNRYGYVTNNPLAMVDPAGLCGTTYIFYTPVKNAQGQQIGITFNGSTYVEDYPGPCNNVCAAGYGYVTIRVNGVSQVACGPAQFTQTFGNCPSGIDCSTGQSTGGAANNGKPRPTVKPPTPPKPKGYGVFLACQFNNAVGHLGDFDFVKTAVVLHAGTAILALTGRVKLAAAGFVALTLFDFGTANVDRIKCTKEAYGDGPSALDGLAPQGD
jgi:RHS repeat-associated protein